MGEDYLDPLRIHSLGFEGYGIAKSVLGTVFVPYTLPGDVIRAQITHRKKNYVFAVVDHYYERSSAHTDPNCEAFGNLQRCGGCDWLDCDYSRQIEYKEQLVANAYQSLLNQQEESFPAVPRIALPEVVASPQIYHYRNKVFLPVAAMPDGSTFYGMFESYSHRVVPHNSCLLQAETFDPICRALMDFFSKTKTEPYQESTQKGIIRHIGLRINQQQDQVLLILVCKSRKLPFSKLLVKELTEQFPNIVGIVQNIQRQPNNVILGSEEQVLYGRDYLDEELCGIKFRLNYRSFYQINSATAELLYRFVAERINASAVVADAYCGIGTISLVVASRAHNVIGIEENPAAIGDANFNKELNNITNVDFVCARVEDYISQAGCLQDIDTIIFDPPRKGLATEIIDAIASSIISMIIYVSCHPLTFRRDLTKLLEHGFCIQEMQCFDMFPHTWHVESVAVLRRI